MRFSHCQFSERNPSFQVPERLCIWGDRVHIDFDHLPVEFDLNGVSHYMGFPAGWADSNF